MNEGMFMALKAEAQETNSLLKQLLEELRSGKQAPPSKENIVAKPDIPPEAVGAVTVETVETVQPPESADKATSTDKARKVPKANWNS